MNLLIVENMNEVFLVPVASIFEFRYLLLFECV